MGVDVCQCIFLPSPITVLRTIAKQTVCTVQECHEPISLQLPYSDPRELADSTALYLAAWWMFMALATLSRTPHSAKAE